MNTLETNPQILEQTYISVETDEGMFSTERAVTINLYNGDKVSLFADLSLLKEKNGEWFLEVTPVKRNGKSQVVLLPTEVLGNSSRWVEVELK